MKKENDKGTHLCCICSKEIKNIEGYFGLWEKSTVITFAPTYGSEHDSDIYSMGFCDDCITKLSDKKLIKKLNNEK